MKHHVKKIKIRNGQDANQSMLKKMAYGLVKHGKIETTVKRAKILQGYMDRLIVKAKKDGKLSLSHILTKVINKESADKIINVIAPVFTDRNSGFLKSKKLGRRLSDGAEMAKLEWVKPIVEEKKLEVKTDKKEIKK